MKSANKEMRRQYGKIDVNKIERFEILFVLGKVDGVIGFRVIVVLLGASKFGLDEMEDLVAMSNELGDSLGRSYEVPDCIFRLNVWELTCFVVDEEDLEAELEALGDELAMEDELKEEEGAVPRYILPRPLV
jgi:charged multivesicular body protein 5